MRFYTRELLNSMQVPEGLSPEEEDEYEAGADQRWESAEDAYEQCIVEHEDALAPPVRNLIQLNLRDATVRGGRVGEGMAGLLPQPPKGRDNAVTVTGRTNRKLHPATEQGVAMLSSVLKSKRAIQVNVEIMRAFVRLRQILATHADLAQKLDELEKEYDKKFAVVFEAIRQLMAPPEKPKARIGFHRR